MWLSGRKPNYHYCVFLLRTKQRKLKVGELPKNENSTRGRTTVQKEPDDHQMFEDSDSDQRVRRRIKLE